MDSQTEWRINRWIDTFIHRLSHLLLTSIVFGLRVITVKLVGHSALGQHSPGLVTSWQSAGRLVYVGHLKESRSEHLKENNSFSYLNECLVQIMMK